MKPLSETPPKSGETDILARHGMGKDTKTKNPATQQKRVLQQRNAPVE